MGSYYSLGVIQKFTATSNQSLSNEEWVKKLNERVDVSLFDLQTMSNKAQGVLQSEIFSSNISGFYEVLRTILGKDRNSNLDYYEEEYGTEIEEYQKGSTRLKIKEESGCEISLNITFALLMIEGKVLVEEFNTDPILINWLFRNSKIENKLAGCIVSSIVG